MSELKGGKKKRLRKKKADLIKNLQDAYFDIDEELRVGIGAVESRVHVSKKRIVDVDFEGIPGSDKTKLVLEGVS